MPYATVISFHFITCFYGPNNWLSTQLIAFAFDISQIYRICSNRSISQFSKQVNNMTTLELSVASPKLHEYGQDWQLAVPGSYEPHRPLVRISGIKNCLTFMTSKQHPRKLTILGNISRNFLHLGIFFYIDPNAVFFESVRILKHVYAICAPKTECIWAVAKSLTNHFKLHFRPSIRSFKAIHNSQQPVYFVFTQVDYKIAYWNSSFEYSLVNSLIGAPFDFFPTIWKLISVFSDIFILPLIWTKAHYGSGCNTIW